MSNRLFAVAVIAVTLTGCGKKDSGGGGGTASPAKTGTQVATASVRVVGWVEYVRLTPGSALLKAKLDAGALTSSLDVREVQMFRKQAQDWVRFTYMADGSSITV